jgi:hypothetical protein
MLVRARRRPAATSPMRSFDPRAVGTLECRAWETYYRRQWGACLVAFVSLVRAAFRMSWPRTLAGAWLVLRANMKWAQLPVNDPDGARALMTRFYRLVRDSEGSTLDPARAARLEVEWWRLHRANQHGAGPGAHQELVAALRDLYAYSYETDPELVRPAAELRAEAMAISDRWVADGCDPEDPNLARERALLVRSYAALLAAVHR